MSFSVCNIFLHFKLQQSNKCTKSFYFRANQIKCATFQFILSIEIHTKAFFLLQPQVLTKAFCFLRDPKVHGLSDWEIQTVIDVEMYCTFTLKLFFSIKLWFFRWWKKKKASLSFV